MVSQPVFAQSATRSWQPRSARRLLGKHLSQPPPLLSPEESMSDHTSHKLWGGRFAVPTASALDALNRSIGVDYRLWPFDIELSRAWSVALWGARVLSLEESKRIEKG